MTTQRLGFVGLGDMGAPIAWRLIEAGFQTTLWARRLESLDPYSKSPAMMADTLVDLGRVSEVVGICVVNDDDVRSVVLGEAGVLSGMKAGGTIMVHSTVHPTTCAEIAEAASVKGVRVLDVPVSGGNAKARQGELVALVGGDRSTYEEMQPIIRTFARNIVYLGPLGSGQYAKAINNTVMTANIGLAEEAARLAAARGLDSSALLEALSYGSGGSFALDVLRNVPGGLREFSAGGLLRKDVDIFEDLIAASDHERGVLGTAAEWSLGVMGIPRKGHHA